MGDRMSAWWPEDGEKEDDGVARVESVPDKHVESVDALARYIAEKNWRENDYWESNVLRIRWRNGALYEFAINVESEPAFYYAAKELPHG